MIEAVYQRRRKPTEAANLGRESIVVVASYVNNNKQPQNKPARRKKPPIPPERADELLEEVILSLTLNQLRECKTEAQNLCPTFIITQDIKVCQGLYDPILVKAWEEWDAKHGCENDHPNFPDKQLFVLEHGRKDLESFHLSNFGEARSLLVQVTFGLAVAEAAFEFEHRDLHCFAKTNVLWLIYLVEILLTKKKSFERSSDDERELGSLKMRMQRYESAKEAVSDPFFF